MFIRLLYHIKRQFCNRKQYFFEEEQKKSQLSKQLRSFDYVSLIPLSLSASPISLSACVTVVSKGSPSRIRIVLLISLGITTLPRSSILLTIPVAFIVFVPFTYKFKSVRDFAEHFLFALLFFHLCGGLFIYIFLLQFASK